MTLFFNLFTSQEGFRVSLGSKVKGTSLWSLGTNIFIRKISRGGEEEDNKIQSSLEEQVYGSSLPYILVCPVVTIEKNSL